MLNIKQCLIELWKPVLLRDVFLRRRFYTFLKNSESWSRLSIVINNLLFRSCFNHCCFYWIFILVFFFFWAKLTTIGFSLFIIWIFKIQIFFSECRLLVCHLWHHLLDLFDLLFMHPNVLVKCFQTFEISWICSFLCENFPTLFYLLKLVKNFRNCKLFFL